MNFFFLLLLATAISLDGLGVGVTYGLKGTIIPWQARLLVALVSAITVTLAFFFGGSLHWLFPPGVAVALGRIILVLAGIWLFFQGWLAGKNNADPDGENLQLASLPLKSLGIVILIIRRPASADLDRSGRISAGEALLLGLALATDAFGAGAGAGALREWPFYTPLLVGLGKFLFLSAGWALGRIWAKNLLLPWINSLPGLLLIFLGLTGF